MLRKLLRRDAFDPTGLGSNATTGLSVYDWAKQFLPGAQVGYNGNRYQAYKVNDPGGNLSTRYRTNPAVFALQAIRVMLFAEARLQFQQFRNGRPGDLFGTPDLAILEKPWPGATTRDLLAQAEMDVFNAGNSYWTRDDDSLLWLDPAKTTIATEARTNTVLTGQYVGERLAGYIFKPTNDPSTWSWYEATEVAHYFPYPSAGNRFIGMSWLSPCMPDVQMDETITAHKRSTLDNGATLAQVVSFDPSITKEQFDGWVMRFRRDHEGPQNANKTLFLGGGADVKTVGQTFENLALQATQGASEVRIGACAGVPPTIVGFSEGLKGSTLNAGNYGQARRRLADGTMRPLWGAFASSMQTLVTSPNSASRLWYDDRDIAFLREDLADQAHILDTNAGSILKLVQGGFKPDAAIEAVLNGDIGRLTGQHTGLYSVQLQAPLNGEMPGGEDVINTTTPPPTPPPVSNGKRPALTP